MHGITGGRAISNAAASKKNSRLVVGPGSRPVAQNAMTNATRIPMRGETGDPPNSNRAAANNDTTPAIGSRRA